MKKKFGSRLLSLLLAVTMVAGYLGMLPPTQADAAVVEYATPATEAELDNVQKWFSGNDGAGGVTAYAKIIGGDVYVWGKNTSYALGITSYKDADGAVHEVANGTVVPIPTKIPSEHFNNEKIERVRLSFNAGVAVAESGNIYMWGSNANNYFKAAGDTAHDGHTPLQLNTDAYAGHKVTYLAFGATNLYVQVDTGEWYTASAPGGASRGTDLQLGTGAGVKGSLIKVPDSLYTLLGITSGNEIKKIFNSWTETAYVLLKNGKLFGFGVDSLDNCHTLGVGTGQTYVETPLELTNYTGTRTIKADDGTTSEITGPSDLNGLKIIDMTTEDQGRLVLTDTGDVWGWGTNTYRRFGDHGWQVTDSTVIYQTNPVKCFDHNVYQKKGVRVFMSFTDSFILCEDNTVYALGRNPNGMIVPNGDDYVVSATQVASNLSQNHTLVGIAPNDLNVMFLTKTGDMFFLGDNSTGGAADGSTVSQPSGTISDVVSSTLPPSAPLTDNKVSFEVETTENNKTVKYRAVDQAGVRKYLRTATNEADRVVDTFTVDAGTNFKLNVYFTDFGKINTFVMPIRFNPEHLEVVNGNGKPYSSSSEVVSPGAIGASVGIEQCFDIQDWVGGQLAVGLKDSTYPKISNVDGWISVAGYSSDSNPIIQGTVKMFSISFRAKTTVNDNGIVFDFATKDNFLGNTKFGSGYDISCNGLGDDGLAYWSIYNASGNGGESGYFEFANDPFPAFNSKLVILRGLTMGLSYGDSNTPIAESLGKTGEGNYPTAPYKPGWTINWANNSVVYTIKSNPYSDEAKTQPGASFPQVKWTFDTAQVTGANNLDRTWEDYITIIDTQDTYVKFRVNPNFTPVTDEDPGYIRVTSTSQHYTGVNAVYYISLRGFAAPETLELAQKADEAQDTLTRIPDGQTIIYHYSDSTDENYKFYVDFNGAVNNTDVVWKLLDKNGNPIDTSSPTAKASLTIADKSVIISPQYTTAGEDYITLHVESLFDASKFDEVKIKIQLYATKLGFKPETIRMAVMKDSIPSTVDLGNYLQVQPADVYATDYSWQICATPTRDPENATEINPSFTPGTPVTYGTLGTGSTASVFSAFEYATPQATPVESGLPEEFVTVRVTDNLSGKTADIKIAIMDLNCPIGIDQFVATNNLGYQNDTVFVKSGLKLGDKIRFYPSYEDAIATTNMYSETTIVEGMHPYFTFVVGNRDGGVMEGGGGFLAVTITRTEEGGVSEQTYDPVPVSYSAEPSLVDGYVHLFGKNSGSIADQDIRVDLEGLNFKETVYTNSIGYFKFTKYIAPGNYKMIVSKKNYLTRRMQPNAEGVGGIDIVVNDDGEFHISTSTQPILLFPGELTNDNAITVQDINYYVANWVGQTDGNIPDYELYDFKEDNIIGMTDLELLLMRKDWLSGSYPIWNVPQQ